MAFDTFRMDLRYGARALARTPGFTFAAVLTLALGIGAASAVFAAVDAILLEPLPYENVRGRVMIWSRWKDFDKTWLSDAEVLDYRARARTLAEVAAWSTGQANLTGDGDPIRIGTARITANTFPVLGSRPLVGRGFTPAEEQAAQNVAVISHGLWLRRYGGDSAVVGRAIQVNGTARVVVGVMPAGFQLPTDYGEDAANPTQLWTPLRLDPEVRGSHGLYGAATLAPGATAEQASAELEAITANLTREGLYPEAMEFSALAVRLDEEILGGVRPALLLVAAAVALLLLIACANVASLLLVRAEARQREMALRSALGARRGRLARQLCTESLLLAAAATAIGLGLAFAGVRILASMELVDIPRAAGLALNSRAVAFTAALGLFTILLFGIAPALRLLRVDVSESLREGGYQGTASRRQLRARGLLVIVEMALAVMLLIGAGLMIRSLRALAQIDLGFDPTNVLTLRLSLPAATYDTPEKVVLFYQRLLDRIRPLPGIRHAGVVRALPLGTTIGDWGVDVEGFTESPGHNAKGDWQIVSDGAFEAMGERLVRGRLFTAADRADREPVAIVNETMARLYWRDGDPLGRRMRLGGPDEDRPWLTVVGVVADERHNGLTGLIKEKFYVPHSQFHRSVGSAFGTMFVVARTDGEPLALAGPIRAEIRALDPNLPVSNVRTMSEVVAGSIAMPRLTGFVLAVFAVAALGLSAIGIYGVLSYLVSQRKHEIGIRMAVGASAREIVLLIVGRGLAYALAGVALGVGGAVVLTRLMTSLLYEITPLDPVTFSAVPLGLAAVASAASAIPALRATRVDPLALLRAG